MCKKCLGVSNKVVDYKLVKIGSYQTMAGNELYPLKYITIFKESFEKLWCSRIKVELFKTWLIVFLRPRVARTNEGK